MYEKNPQQIKLFGLIRFMSKIRKKEIDMKLIHYRR